MPGANNLGVAAVVLVGVALFVRDLGFMSGEAVEPTVDNVSQLVQRRYPGMEVVGSNYPIAPHKALMAKAVTGAQMGVLAMVVMGDRMWGMLGMPPPEFYTQNVAQNRGAWGMGAWFVGNMVAGNLQNTGAFEVYWNGHLVFSKKQTNRMPNVDELWAGLHAAMRASGYPVREEGTAPPGDQPGGGEAQGQQQGRSL